MHNKFHLSVDKYINNHIRDVREDALRLKFLFYFLNLLFAVGTLGTTVLTTILISKIWIDYFPIWFYYATTGISALTSFFTSILNFFVVKDKYLLRQKQLTQLRALSFIKTKTKKEEYEKFISAAIVLENKQAIKDVNNE